MNKNDLCLEVAKKTGMSKADVSKAVDATLDAITDALKKNDDVRLVGFGTYSVTERSASRGAEPAHRRADQDPGVQARQVQAGQGSQRRPQLSRGPAASPLRAGREPRPVSRPGAARWCGRKASNLRHRRCKRRALPLSYARTRGRETRRCACGDQAGSPETIGDGGRLDSGGRLDYLQAIASGGVAQSVRALACHARGRGFKSRHSRHPLTGSIAPRRRRSAARRAPAELCTAAQPCEAALNDAS